MSTFWERLVFYFTFPRTPTRVREVTNAGWAFAAAYMEINDPGKPPPVVLRPEKWEIGGVWVIGRFNVLKVFGLVLKERISLVDANNVFENMAHESVHSLMARNNLGRGEVLAEEVESMARKHRKVAKF